MRNSKWVRLLAYVTGSVNQELLLQNEYLAAENPILRTKLPARLRLTDPERVTLAESESVWEERRCGKSLAWPNPTRSWSGAESSWPRNSMALSIVNTLDSRGSMKSWKLSSSDGEWMEQIA